MSPHSDHIDGSLEQRLHFQADFAQSAPAQEDMFLAHGQVSAARSLHLIGGWIAGSIHLFQSEAWSHIMMPGYCLERGWGQLGSVGCED